MGSCLDDESSSSSEGEIDKDVERIRGLHFRRQQTRKLKDEQAHTAEILRSYREREAARQAAANENAKLRARASINSGHSGATSSSNHSTCGNREYSCRDVNTADDHDVPVWLEHEKRWSLLEGPVVDFSSSCSSGTSSRHQHIHDQEQLDSMDDNSSLLWPPRESGILKGMASAAKASEKYHKRRNQGKTHHHDLVSASDGSHDEEILLKAVYKKASLRWHPDKFQNRFASLLASDCRTGGATEILERVKRISQQINKEWGELRPR